MKVDLTRYQNRHGQKLKRLVWEVVWLLLFRPTPRWCLNGWRRCLLRVFGARLEKGVRIQGRARCWQPWRLSVGAGSWIDAEVNLYAVDEIRIGSNAVISAEAFLCTASHDITSSTYALKTAPIHVGDMAWIGARAIVLPGTMIGTGAVVAAGSVVTHDVPDWTVVAGNPAHEIKKRVVRA